MVKVGQVVCLNFISGCEYTVNYKYRDVAEYFSRMTTLALFCQRRDEDSWVMEKGFKVLISTDPEDLAQK
jgi:hypothetical protein